MYSPGIFTFFPLGQQEAMSFHDQLEGTELRVLKLVVDQEADPSGINTYSL
jgi:hypothetical protein